MDHLYNGHFTIRNRWARSSIIVARLLCALLLSCAWLPSSQAQKPFEPAPLASQRVIVRLAGQPLLAAGLARGQGATLDAQAARQLDALQQTRQLFASALQASLPGAEVEHEYTLAFHGVAVRLPQGDARALERLASLPGVERVYEESVFSPALFSSLPAIGAPTLWSQLGGSSQAGAGVKVAILDSGIAANHEMLAPAGLTYPTGFPKGDARYTTPKVIAARTYIRPWDAPYSGEASPTPGSKGSGHGTQVASIVAGGPVTATTRELDVPISGVAPRAWLMNYRIFYPSPNTYGEVAYTAEVLRAIEDAVADGADVLCLAWASHTPRSPLASPEAEALQAAMDAGCVVVAAAGNDGPTSGTASRLPGGIERVITVGSSSKAQVVAYDHVDAVGDMPIPPQLQNQPFARSAFGPPITQPMGPLPFRAVASVALDGSAFGCQPLPPGSLSGQIALVARGQCNFADKVYRAQAAGAVAAIIYSDSDQIIEMGCAGDYCAPGAITIPSLMVSQSFGNQLLAWQQLYPTATLRIDPSGRLVSNQADRIAAHSARGPAFATTLKPDIVAPGEAVLAATFDPWDTDAYMLGSGTSQACALAAGAAALLVQARPTWSHDQIKAALMATARSAGLQGGESAVQPATVLERGAGLIDLARAAQPGLISSPPSISWPNALPGATKAVTLTLSRPQAGGTAVSYTVAVTGSAGLSVAHPAQIAVPVGGSAALPLTLQVASNALDDLQAEIRLSGGGITVSVPLWVRALAPPVQSEVLLIDNDFSNFEAYRDYAHNITATLRAANISYAVWNADLYFGSEQTLPDLSYLRRFPVIIWLTGDNIHPDGYYVLSTPLTTVDQQLLAAYLEGGGRLLALGQNLAQASDVNPDPDPAWGRAPFLHHYLGAHWLQGNLFYPDGPEGQLPPSNQVAIAGAPDGFLAGMGFDLGAIGDAEHYQFSIDEIAPGGLRDGSDADLVQPVLAAIKAQPLGAGYVGVAKAWNPSLEDEQPAIPYRTLYFSFGIEGVNNNPNVSTREELLRRAIDWLRDEVTVTLPSVIGAANEPVAMTCQAASSRGAAIVSYRWRLQDGETTRIVVTAEPQVTWMVEHAGSYPVSVEVTDALGHRAVAHGQMTIIGGGNSTLAVNRASARAGDTLIYTIVARNATAQPLAMRFSLPLPPHTEYQVHVGGAYVAGTLTWEGVLAADSSFSAELWVRVRADTPPGTDIDATAWFEAPGTTFMRNAHTRVMAMLYLPLTLKH